VVETEKQFLADSAPDYAAAFATGVVVRILDRYPKLKPADLLTLIRSSSLPQTENGPLIVNLDAALRFAEKRDVSKELLLSDVSKTIRGGTPKR
jgi:hypothetical protein